MADWFKEEGSDGISLGLEYDRTLYRERSAFQEILIFESRVFGRVLALDGIIQTAERDEYVYHEMLVHVPLLALERPERVLVIGGGDGGALREILKHPVRQVTQVELDAQVVEACRAHLPGLNAGAFDDPRVELVFQDGIAFVAARDQRFDAIIVDSTDPYPPGPGEALFSTGFYEDCRRLLEPSGVLVTQCGVPFLYPDALRQALSHLGAVFEDVASYVTAVPSFAGGYTVYAWASPDPSLRRPARETLARRQTDRGLATVFYEPGLHEAAFAGPTDLALPAR